MRLLSLALVVLLCLPAPAAACEMKQNQVILVLGSSAGEPVTLHLGLRKASVQGSETDYRWEAVATLHRGKQSWPVPETQSRTVDLDAIAATAMAMAGALPDFVPATIERDQDCTRGATVDPRRRCGLAGLSTDGRRVEMGRPNAPVSHPLAVEPAELRITGLTIYRLGKRRLAVVNLAQSGGAKHGESLKVCASATLCRGLTGLHHGEQFDVLLPL